MSSTVPDASTQFKINPKTLKYLKRTFDIVDRAITQADIVFPMSRWPAYDCEGYSEFRETRFWKLDGEIRKCDPKVSDGLIDLIIVEAEQAISVLVAIRKHGIDGEADRFNKAEATVKKLVNNLNSAIEIVSEISKDTSLSKMLIDVLRGFQKDADLFFVKFNDIHEYNNSIFIREIVDEAKPMLYIMATLIRVNSPLLQLKTDLADSKLIRRAPEYRCASALAWIWWDRLGRYPTLTRNVDARAQGSAPKTAFQTFVEEAVPPPGINKGIIRKVIEDLRFVTKVSITEKPARDMLLRARSDAKLRERGVESARSLLLHSWSLLLGERGRRNFGVRNPQV